MTIRAGESTLVGAFDHSYETGVDRLLDGREITNYEVDFILDCGAIVTSFRWSSDHGLHGVEVVK